MTTSSLAAEAAAEMVMTTAAEAAAEVEWSAPDLMQLLQVQLSQLSSA
jgi:hypothetical protein